MLPRDLVLKFLNDRGVGAACGVCGHREWFLGDTESEFAAQVPILLEKGLQFPTPHLPLIYIVCRNCAHVRFFAKGLIDEWAKGQLLTVSEVPNGG